MELRALDKGTKAVLFFGAALVIIGLAVPDTNWASVGFGGLIILGGLYSEFEGEEISDVSIDSSSDEAQSQYSVTDFQEMSPTKFESVVQSAWENAGYDTEMTSAGPDGGVDVLADNGSERLAIQAKKYTQGNKVGGPVVRKSVGAADQVGADRVVIATSSSFTDPAYTAANQMSTEVELVSGEDLTRMLSS